MSRAALAIVLAFSAGCTLLPRDPASRALAEADARARQGDHAAAITAYDAYLAQYPESEGASRARTARELLRELVTVRGEASALQAQLATARTETQTLRERLSAREAELSTRTAELTTREAEVTRLRPERAAREAEITKLRADLAQRQAEAAKLREDLEQLKRIDLEQERRRR
jgi:chromosome segregation ATPase